MPITFPANPTLNQTYTFNGITWTWLGNLWSKGSTVSSGGGGATVTVGNIAPASPTEGALWIDSDLGDLNAYFSNAWAIVGGGSGTVLASPTIANISGNVISTTASTLTVYGSNFGTLQGTFRFNFGGVVSDVYVLPTTTNILTVAVPVAVYLSSTVGSVGNVLWYKPDGTSSNSYALTVQVPSLSIQYLVVAGGGGGGETIGGGGGAGEVLSGSLAGAVSTAYNVSIGAGGAGGNGGGYPAGSSGSNTIFSSITALAGGAGGGYDVNASGGGGGHGGGQGAGGGAGLPAGTGRNNGGTSGGNSNNAGGGGGAGGVGGNAVSGTSGTGGAGVLSDISGSSLFYGGGGGGGTRSGNGIGGAGGSGIGGTGSTSSATASSGSTNTGSGGGGGGYTTDGPGGSGGSGIVIIKFPSYYSATVSAGLTSSSSTTTGFKIITITAGTGTVTFS